MDDLFAAPAVDTRSVTLLLVTQAALLGVTAGLGSLFGVNPITLPGSLSFDTSSMMFASQIAMALIGTVSASKASRINLTMLSI